MPLTTCNITGEGLFPNNTAPASGYVDAILTGYDTDGSLVAPVVQRAALTAGTFTMALWPNTRGRRNTFYEFRLTIPVTGSEPARVQTIPLGQVKVPVAASRTLVSLMDERDDMVTATTWTSLQIALLAASNGRMFETAALGYASASVAIGDVFMALASGTLTLFKKTGVGAGTSLGPVFPQGLFADGTAAAPGLAFASSTNTGFHRPATGQIGFAVAGAMVALLSSTAFQIDVPVTGSAITASAADATAGRLLKVGDFGLGVTGGPVLLADLDATTTPTSFQRFDATTLGTRPPGVSAGAVGYVRTERVTSANVLQTVTVSSGLPITWQRRAVSSAWQTWYPVSQPTLGTVAQTSGAPTGSLIERGSNGNGEYMRLADGTQICTHSLTAGSGAGTAWTFPAAFAAAPVVAGSAVATVMSSVMLDAAPSTTAVTLSARDKTDARRADPIRVTAIGRWF